jgi:hypothetical protein
MQGAPPCGARSPEHRQLGHLEPEIPGFAPPPRDELALLDTLAIDTDAQGLEETPRHWRFRIGSEPHPVPALSFDPGLAEPTTSAAVPARSVRHAIWVVTAIANTPSPGGLLPVRAPPPCLARAAVMAALGGETAHLAGVSGLARGRAA